MAKLGEKSKVYGIASYLCATGHEIRGVGSLLIGRGLKVSPTQRDLGLANHCRVMAEDLRAMAEDLDKRAVDIDDALAEEASGVTADDPAP
jgi:hypothetical protein